MPYDPRRLGDRILALRRAAGLTQGALARASGVNQTYLSFLERARSIHGATPHRPSPDTLWRLACGLTTTAPVPAPPRDPEARAIYAELMTAAGYGDLAPGDRRVPPRRTAQRWRRGGPNPGEPSVTEAWTDDTVASQLARLAPKLGVGVALVRAVFEAKSRPPAQRRTLLKALLVALDAAGDRRERR